VANWLASFALPAPPLHNKRVLTAGLNGRAAGSPGSLEMPLQAKAQTMFKQGDCSAPAPHRASRFRELVGAEQLHKAACASARRPLGARFRALSACQFGAPRSPAACEASSPAPAALRPGRLAMQFQPLQLVGALHQAAAFRVGEWPWGV